MTGFLPPHDDDEELELLEVAPEDVSRLIARTRRGRIGAAEIVFAADQRDLPADQVLMSHREAVAAMRRIEVAADEAARERAAKARGQALQRIRTRRSQLAEQGLNQESIDTRVADLEASVPSGEPEPVADAGSQYATQEGPVPFAAELVSLLARHAAEVDDQIATFAQDWRLDRMPAVDRVVARLGTAELLHGSELDDPDHSSAVLAEWVTVARVLSTEDSPRYLNALLQRIADMRSLLG